MLVFMTRNVKNHWCICVYGIYLCHWLWFWCAECQRVFCQDLLGCPCSTDYCQWDIL